MSVQVALLKENPGPRCQDWHLNAFRGDGFGISPSKPVTVATNMHFPFFSFSDLRKAWEKGECVRNTHHGQTRWLSKARWLSKGAFS